MEASKETAFATNVKRYIELDERIRKSVEETKALKVELAALGGTVVQYMDSVKKTHCDAGDVNLIVSTSNAQLPLSMPLLRDVFKKQFPTRPDLVDALCKAIQTHRKQGATVRKRLKRVRKRSIAVKS